LEEVITTLVVTTPIPKFLQTISTYFYSLAQTPLSLSFIAGWAICSANVDGVWILLF